VLELTAIFFSAGAGFRLAKALIAPGDRLRKEALVVEGTIAVRMMGAVVTLLAVAGASEGLLSASTAAAGWKYGVSAATAGLLALYLASGWAHLRELGARSSGRTEHGAV
ncbi:MAG: stage II sporulation protein M, partial [Gemmatimonadales bacterium]